MPDKECQLKSEFNPDETVDQTIQYKIKLNAADIKPVISINRRRDRRDIKLKQTT